MSLDKAVPIAIVIAKQIVVERLESCCVIGIDSNILAR